MVTLDELRMSGLNASHEPMRTRSWAPSCPLYAEGAAFVRHDQLSNPEPVERREVLTLSLQPRLMEEAQEDYVA